MKNVTAYLFYPRTDENGQVHKSYVYMMLNQEDLHACYDPTFLDLDDAKPYLTDFLDFKHTKLPNTSIDVNNTKPTIKGVIGSALLCDQEFVKSCYENFYVKRVNKASHPLIVIHINTNRSKIFNFLSWFPKHQNYLKSLNKMNLKFQSFEAPYPMDDKALLHFENQLVIA